MKKSRKNIWSKLLILVFVVALGATACNREKADGDELPDPSLLPTNPEPR